MKHARSHQEAQQEFIAYYKELNIRRNTLLEILQMRITPWVFICGAITFFVVQFIGMQALPYSIFASGICLLVVLVIEILRNKKRSTT